MLCMLQKNSVFRGKCSNITVVKGKEINCRNGRYRSIALLSDTFGIQIDTVVVNSVKYYGYVVMSSELPRRILRGIYSQMNNTNLKQVELEQLKTAARISAIDGFILTLASIRETYEVFEGQNLSLVDGKYVFYGSATVFNPFLHLVTFDQAKNLFDSTTSGLYCVSHGEYVSVKSDSVRSFTSETHGTLVSNVGKVLCA